MRPASTLLNETSLVRDWVMSVPTTPKNPVPMMMTESMNGTAVDNGLVAPITAMVAPELIARVRAMLRAAKVTRMQRSRLDAQ